jgi:8-oxo-dGTP diphosphatase
VNGFSSSGCRRCCSYGSPEQQLKAAEHLASLIDRPLVRVGVAVLLRQGSAVLMGLRKGSHGAGTWSFPGGHLEPGETVIECAARELREETGIALDPHDFRKVTFTNDVFEAEGRHYVTLYMETSRGAGLAKPKVLEPDKCAEWRWWSEPPSDLFLPIRNLLADGFEIWR